MTNCKFFMARLEAPEAAMLELRKKKDEAVIEPEKELNLDYNRFYTVDVKTALSIIGGH